MSLRPATLHGGPLDGQDGEVVTPLPGELLMGQDGGFVYRLDTVRDGRAVFRYDPKATRARLLDLGVHPELLKAADDPDTAGLLAAGARLDPGEGRAFDVTIHRFEDRWELHVSGTLVEQQPRSAFPDDDTDGLAQWAEAAVHALAQEALR